MSQALKHFVRLFESRQFEVQRIAQIVKRMPLTAQFDLEAWLGEVPSSKAKT